MLLWKVLQLRTVVAPLLLTLSDYVISPTLYKRYLTSRSAFNGMFLFLLMCWI